jgi:demethylmenaquinone methyltransferase/2-methoxy-6-polyprenyl-1,4-benzoquinol methylase
MDRTDQSLTRAFYDRISKAYDGLADANEHLAREKGLDLLDIQSGENVLEIGYGTGHSLVELAKRVGPGGSVSGLDISQGMHDVAKRRVDEAGVGNRVKLQVGAAPRLPYPDDAFDAVSMSFTLELFPLDIIPAVLAETRRVLRPSGRIGVVAMTVVAEGVQESLLERTYKWMHQHFPHIVDCQPIPATQLLRDAGFRIQRQEIIDIWTMPVSAIVAGL